MPAPVPVHVLCDQGLGSRDLWAQIRALGCPLGRHPCLRYPSHVTFQPTGQTQRVAVRSLITGPGDLWVGTGRAFRDAPWEATRGPLGRALHDFGQAQPWVRLTDTPVAETNPTLYACRNWIEQGFRGLKTVGWKWHKTRRLDPGALWARVGRHWLVLAGLQDRTLGGEIIPLSQHKLAMFVEYPCQGSPVGAGGPSLAGAGDCHLAGRGLARARRTPRRGTGRPAVCVGPPPS